MALIQIIGKAIRLVGQDKNPNREEILLGMLSQAGLGPSPQLLREELGCIQYNGRRPERSPFEQALSQQLLYTRSTEKTCIPSPAFPSSRMEYPPPTPALG